MVSNDIPCAGGKGVLYVIQESENLTPLDGASYNVIIGEYVFFFGFQVSGFWVAL